MRQMAGLASVGLHWLMFEYERTLLVRMAFKADGILRRGSAHLFGARRSVHVVAIAALHQPLVHTMMEGHVELRFLLEMAGVTKLGLRLNEQKLRFLCVVWRMAGNAADVIPRVLGIDRVHVLRTTGMAGEAARVDFFRRSVLKRKNFAYIPATVDVGLARTVARFAPLPLRASLRVEGGYKMWRRLKALDKILVRLVGVAGLAGFFPNLKGWVRGCRITFLMVLACGWLSGGLWGRLGCRLWGGLRGRLSRGLAPERMSRAEQ